MRTSGSESACRPLVCNTLLLVGLLELTRENTTRCLQLQTLKSANVKGKYKVEKRISKNGKRYRVSTGGLEKRADGGVAARFNAAATTPRHP